MKKIFLDAQDIQQGKELLQRAFESVGEGRNRGIEEFFEWVDTNFYVDLALVKEVFSFLLLKDDSEKAHQTYDEMFRGFIPVLYFALKRVNEWWKALLLLATLIGTIGGILYMFEVIRKWSK